MEMLERDISVESTNRAYHQESSWLGKLPLMSYMSNLITSFKRGNENQLKIDSFESMENLMLLQLNYVRLSGSYARLPKGLRWLCWHGFPSKSIPSGIPMEKLVVLDMRYSKLVQVWKGFKVIPSLKILDLSYSKELVKTPNFRGLPSLESLILKGCVSLIEVCESVKGLKELVLLDLKDCTSLLHIPHLPSSLQTLELLNCSLQPCNALRAKDVNWLDSLPLFLVSLTVRGCSLSDHCFPGDWSGLVSLVHLDLSGNPITALPTCVRNLSSLEKLAVDDCSRLRCVADVPSTVKTLTLTNNRSLVDVSVDPSVELEFLDYDWSGKLQEVKGCFKLASIENVDQKIKLLLGLGFIGAGAINSNNDTAQNFPTPRKVLYEFGIFSTVMTVMLAEELPSCFMFVAKWGDITFKVPSLPSDRRISGFNIMIAASFPYTSRPVAMLKIEIRNTTRGIKWIYVPSTFFHDGLEPGFLWSSLWKCGDLLGVGDEVQVRIHDSVSLGCKVTWCGVNLVFDKDAQTSKDLSCNKDGIEETNAKGGTTFPHLSWCSKLFVKVSDYCNDGKEYIFLGNERCHAPSLKVAAEGAQIVDWWGPKSLVTSTHEDTRKVRRDVFQDSLSFPWVSNSRIIIGSLHY